MVECMASMDIWVDRLKNCGEGDVQFGFDIMVNNDNLKWLIDNRCWGTAMGIIVWEGNREIIVAV